MTDLVKLRQIIDDRGYKLTKLAEYLGISRQSMSRKMNGHNSFTAAEISVLCDVLCITRLSDKDAIFFAKDVAKKAT